MTTFALPDLRGRLPMGAGHGSGLPNYLAGESGGTEVVTLTVPQMPLHTHTAFGSAASGTKADPTGQFWAAEPTSDVAQFSNADPAQASMAANALTSSGGSQPHDNIQPFLCVNFVIALEGIFPSRN